MANFGYMKGYNIRKSQSLQSNNYALNRGCTIKVFCQQFPTPTNIAQVTASLNVVSVQGTVPRKWQTDFEQLLGKNCKITWKESESFKASYKVLETGIGLTKDKATPDLVLATDQQVWTAFKDGLLQPIPGSKQYKWYNTLPTRWQEYINQVTPYQSVAYQSVAQQAPYAADSMTQNVPDSVDTWIAPLSWGCVMVAYNPDKIIRSGGKMILDWVDLLQPQLRGKLGMPRNSRLLSAVALKSLGLSHNSNAKQLQQSGVSIGAWCDRMEAIRKQVKILDESQSVQAIKQGALWATIGYSNPILQVVSSSNTLRAMVPRTGTVLTADLWLVPARGGMRPSPLLPLWLDYCSQPSRQLGVDGLRQGALPRQLAGYGVASSTKKQRFQKTSGSIGEVELLLSGRDGFMPKQKLLNQSEFLLPLDPVLTAAANERFKE